MTDTEPRIMLLDSASLYFRAFFGLPETVAAPDGTPVNAVRGFLEFIARLVRDYSPTHVAACWDDDWRPQFRVDAIPSYKAHRVADPTSDAEEVPDALSPQVPIIADVLAALGIARVGSAGFEADDVIGTLTASARGPVRIVTGDRDLFQLVDDARRVAVLYTAAKGVGRAELVDAAWLSARYSIPPGTYADFAILRGDPSDGLPGVRGVGDKTAAALVTEFGDLAGIIAAAEAEDSTMRPAMRAKITDAADYLRVAPVVVRVATGAPLPPDLDLALPSAPADPARLAELARTWGLETPIMRVVEAMARAAR